MLEVERWPRPRRYEPGSNPNSSTGAEALLRELGLSATEAITLFYIQVTMHRGLPFEVTIPNAETTEALQQAESRADLTEYTTLEELKTAPR